MNKPQQKLRESFRKVQINAAQLSFLQGRLPRSVCSFPALSAHPKAPNERWVFRATSKYSHRLDQHGWHNNYITNLQHIFSGGSFQRGENLCGSSVKPARLPVHLTLWCGHTGQVQVTGKSTKKNWPLRSFERKTSCKRNSHSELFQTDQARQTEVLASSRCRILHNLLCRA